MHSIHSMVELLDLNELEVSKQLKSNYKRLFERSLE